MLADKKILLLDGSPQFKGYQKDGFSNRVFALSKGTVELLNSIGAWDTITSIRCKPVKQMQVFDSIYVKFRIYFFCQRNETKRVTFF